MIFFEYYIITITLPKSIKQKKQDIHTKTESIHVIFKCKMEMGRRICEIKTTQKQFIKILSIKYGINRNTSQQKYNLYQNK